MRIFLDAKVLFSAAKSNAAVRHLLTLLFDAGHECWADEYVVAEARRNLHAKGADALEDFHSLLKRLHVGNAPAPTRSARTQVAWLPEKDRPVLAAAIGLRCNVLITGDRTHFGSGYGKAFAGVVIHSPRSMAEFLFNR